MISKILVIALVFSMFSCSHHSKLKLDKNNKSLINNSIQKPVVILNTEAFINNINGKYTSISYDIEVREAVFEEIERTLSEKYTILKNTTNHTNDYMFKITPSFKEYNVTSSQKTVYHILQLSYAVENSKGKILIIENIEDAFITYPASVDTLGFITGLTLFLASPITFPVSAIITGNNAEYILGNKIKYLIESSNSILEGDNEQLFIKNLLSDTKILSLNETLKRFTLEKLQGLSAIANMNSSIELENHRKMIAVYSEVGAAVGRSMLKSSTGSSQGQIESDSNDFISTNNCGIKPIPKNGCRIGRCVDGYWEQVCEQYNCGIRPIPEIGCRVGRCVDGSWEQVCEPYNCGIRPIPKLGCLIGRCVGGNWEQVCK